MTYIQTYSGRRIELLKPDPYTIELDDIAHHLSLINRFSGATQLGWNVAAHSLLVEALMAREGCSPAECFHGLMHDAPEFALGDTTSPVKQALRRLMLAGFGREFDLLDDLHRHLWEAIEVALDLPVITGAQRKLVKRFDLMACALEAREFLPGGPVPDFAEYLDGVAAGWRTLAWPREGLRQAAEARWAETAFKARFTALRRATLAGVAA